VWVGGWWGGGVWCGVLGFFGGWGVVWGVCHRENVPPASARLRADKLVPCLGALSSSRKSSCDEFSISIGKNDVT